jgi:signal transduction histidine kinase
LEQIRQRSADDSAPKSSHVDLALQTARESLAEARLFIEDLRPRALDQGSLPNALTQLAKSATRETNIEVTATVTGSPHSLPSDVETALLRISQEALANIRKHARANRAVLTLSFMDNSVTLDIIDDGIGFDYDATRAHSHRQDGSGFGLASMQERAAQIGATFSIDSALGSGTTLTVEVKATTGGNSG